MKYEKSYHEKDRYESRLRSVVIMKRVDYKTKVIGFNK